MSAELFEKIPNNVNLSSDKRLQRALEQWLPNYISWWREMGPDHFHEDMVYLRTAVSVGSDGWAHFDHVRMPDYRWGIFLEPPTPDRKIAFGSFLGQPVWQEVPGQVRNTLRRIIVTQGDTEPASVEQQRMLGQPREGTLAWDRQRLIDSIGRSTRLAVESYDQTREAAELAMSARQAVVNAGLAGVGASIGVIIAVVAHMAFLDFTGVFAGIALAALGVLVLPARKRKSKGEFTAKLTDLRTRLVGNLEQQFERELRRGAQRIEDTIAPFDRFVRAEQARLGQQQTTLQELEAEVADLRRALQQGG